VLGSSLGGYIGAWALTVYINNLQTGGNFFLQIVGPVPPALWVHSCVKGTQFVIGSERLRHELSFGGYSPGSLWSEVPQWGSLGLSPKSWSSLLTLFADFDCKNDQNVKISHNSPDSWPVYSRWGAKRHFGGFTPSPWLAPPPLTAWTWLCVGKRRLEVFVKSCRQNSTVHLHHGVLCWRHGRHDVSTVSVWHE